MTVCKELAASGEITAAKVMWSCLRRCQRKPLKTTRCWAAEVGSKDDLATSEWLQQQGDAVAALDEPEDWHAQWLRMCAEDAVTETQQSAESVEDL